MASPATAVCNMVLLSSRSSPSVEALSTRQLHHTAVTLMGKSAVKVAKQMLRKTTKSGEDQYLALLNITNVPTQGVDSSPAQRLMRRRTRTLLLTTQSLLESMNLANRHESEQLPLNQMRQAKYYNRSAHDLPKLKAGDTVRMKPFVTGQKSWEKAEVTGRLDEGSYEVQTPGTTFRRNRQHLVKTSQPPSQEDTLKQGKAEAQVGSNQSGNLQPQAPAVEPSPVKESAQSSLRNYYAGEKTGENITILLLCYNRVVACYDIASQTWQT